MAWLGDSNISSVPFPLRKISLNEFVFLLAVSKVRNARDYEELYLSAILLSPFSAHFSYTEYKMLLKKAQNLGIIFIETSNRIRVIWLMDEIYQYNASSLS